MTHISPAYIALEGLGRLGLLGGWRVGSDSQFPSAWRRAIFKAMNDSDPQRRPYQFSLWSLLVLTTLVAVLCSMVVCTRGVAPLILAVGIAICVVGFGPLSYRKHPEAGFAFAVVGFLIRLVGLGMVALGLFLWLAWGIGR